MDLWSREATKIRSVRDEDTIEGQFDALPKVPTSEEQMSLFAPVSSLVFSSAFAPGMRSQLSKKSIGWSTSGFQIGLYGEIFFI